MLKRFISKKLLAIYFLFIVLTWVESVLNPTLVRMIIDSFQTKNLKILWQILMLGILGNMLIVLGLAGKCYFYAKVIADFDANIKGKMFATFLYENQLANEDILSDLENDVKQIDSFYHSSLNFPSNKIIVDNIV
ncbi:ABC transporter ATP-binding protein [Streptococcus anginosus]|nr:ABC transporter ATP-binding protein [Streptococcus anginosus]